jgi:tight adherence protein B
MWIIALFILVWVLSLGAWVVLSRAAQRSDVERLSSRLLGSAKAQKTKTAETQSLLQQERQAGKVIAHLLKKFNLLPRLQQLIEQAGLKWHPVRVVHGCLGLFILTFFAVWTALPSHLQRLAWVAGILVATIPVVYLLRVRSARLRKFEEQFPESLEFVARSMRAGHAFAVSLEMLYKEFQEPLSGEFKRTFDEHNLGLPLDVALQKLATRVPSLDVHFFVSAVLLQKRTGGNLAEILDKLAFIIRERFKLRGRIRAISAHGRMTGMALTSIPIGVAVLMFFVNPDYVRFFFTDELGNLMMAAAIGLQVLGYLIIKRIVSIEV